MNIGRKIFVLIVSAAVVLSAFIVVYELLRTPKISRSSESFEDVNSYKGKIGKFGQLGIGKVEEARFVDYSSNRQVTREFGFSKLLYQNQNRWQLQNPFMNINKKDVKFSMTSDNGTIIVENILGESKPSEAYLKGNVQIKITDLSTENPVSYLIALDDVNYISNKSLFITKGKVKFDSSEIQLEGQGLEIIYNFENDRLYKVEISKIERLTFNNVNSNKQQKTQAALKQKKNDNNQKVADFDQQRPPVEYSCLLKDNVVVNGPDEIVAAKNFVIRNIFIDSLMKRQSHQKQPPVTFEELPEEIKIRKQTENNIFERKGRYFVSCGKVLIKPINEMESTIEQKSSVLEEKTIENVLNSDKQIRIISNMIDYARKSGDCTAFGRTEFLFYVNDFAENSLKARSVPAMLEAGESVKYNAADAQITFSGDCKFNLLKSDKSQTQQWSLSAAEIKVNLSRQETLKVEKITAADNPVVQIITADEKKNTKLTARQLDYDAMTEQVKAAGNVKIDFYSSPPVRNKSIEKIQSGISSDNAVFYFDIRQGVFEGNCYFWADADSNSSGGYQLWADKITADISSGAQADIDHITALGSVVIKTAPAAKDAGSETRFTAKKIEYDKLTSDISADGPCELLVYTASGKEKIPLIIKTQNKVQYFLNSDRAVFDGNNVCSMQVTEEGLDKTYVLSSPELEVNFSRDTSDIKHLHAGQENVRVYMLKKSAEKSLGGIELKCGTLDYDKANQMVTTAGSGILKVDNSYAQQQTVIVGKDDEVKELFSTAAPKDIERSAKEVTWWNKTGGFNLEKKCYAFVRDFNSLKIDLDDNKILADSTRKTKLMIDYVPFINGKFEPAVRVTSHSLSAVLDKNKDGRFRLKSLFAGGGVTYEDPENQFVSSKFLYNAQESLIRASGDENYKCMLNGSAVETVEYNLQTGAIKGELDIISVLKY